MVPNYISPADYSLYGIPNGGDELVEQASIVVDAYLGIQEGLIYAEDSEGFPVHMSRCYPRGMFTLKQDIKAGANVRVSMTPGPILSAGSVIVLDKDDPDLIEVCKIASVIDAKTIVLQSVAKDHAADASLHAGLCIEQNISVPRGRYFITLPNAPLVRVISLRGRVSYTRRGDAYGLPSTDTGILTSLQQFGGAPVWQDVNFSMADVDLQKNQIWTPMGMMMSPFTEVQISYVAGFPESSVPSAVSLATSMIAKAIRQSPASAGIKSYKAGEVQMERFIESVVDDEIRSLLSPYRGAYYG